MTRTNRRRQSKWYSWEFWPAWLFNLPVALMWLTQSLLRWDLFFFARVNPMIETGGFFSEEKWNIYQHLPDEYLPKHVLVNSDEPESTVLAEVQQDGIRFPMLIKPNIGERGMGIAIIRSADELYKYHHASEYQYIVQEFITHPLEMSVLAFRHPVTNQIIVTSVCQKEKLIIIGDGYSTIEELIQKNYRAKKQWSRLKEKFDEKRILKVGERLLLEPIGNHSRGTTFVNRNDLIHPEFTRVIESMFNKIEGDFQYGRFDILYTTIEDFLTNRNIIIVEFNGVGSEPAHIYQPGYPLLSAYVDLWKNIQIVGMLSKYQRAKGVETMSRADFLSAIKKYRRNLNQIKRVMRVFNQSQQSSEKPTFEHA